MCSKIISSLTILVHLHRSFAFIHCNQVQQHYQHSTLHASNTDGIGESDDDEEDTSPFALPAIGSSSFWDNVTETHYDR